VEFLLPDIGEGTAEGEIVKWYVGPGDAVTEEQDFVEVMTDKATVMIPCPVSGVVGDLLFKEGDVVPVHTAIATFTKVTGGKLAGAHGAAAKASHTAHAEGQVAGHAGGNGAASAPAATALLDEPQARVLATPATRKHARHIGVDIKRLRGTGPHGRITRDDVEKARGGNGGQAVKSAPAPASSPAKAPAKAAPVAARATPAPAVKPAAPKAAPKPVTAAAPLAPLAEGEVEERVPLRGVRRKISEFLSHSKRTAAHYTYVEEVDVTDLVQLRERLKPLAEARGARMTFTAFIVKAATLALRAHPKINAAMDDAKGEIVYKKYFNIGIAADTEQGLMVPVLKGADRRSLLDIARELNRLGEGARSGTLAPDDLQGGTFTITNAGHIGGLLATPILNYPEAAIMGVHKIKRRPWIKDGHIVQRDIMYLSISLDHRVIDGADAARFMNDVVKYLEDPQLFILEGI